jgi:type I restriction enzyme S subunit
MKSYPKYKSSQVDLLNEIPQDWGIWKLKFLTNKIGSGVTPLGGSQVYKTEGVAFFRSQNIYNNNFELSSISFLDGKIHREMKNSQVEIGDVLLNITGASIGRCFFFSGEFPEANVNQHVCIIRANKKILLRFLHSVIISEIGQNQIFSKQSGTNREGLNFEQLKNFDIPLPSIREQQQIADFLDYKTGQCDRFIANRQKQIQLLNEQKAAMINKAVTKGINPNAKMKPSGIEWLPEVPETWEVWKMKFLSKIETGNKNTEDAEEDGEYPFYVRSDKVEKISSYSFEGEAILTAGDGVGVAKVYHYANGKMAIHQRVYKISNFNKRISGEFLYYYIKDNFEKEVIKLSAKTTVDSLRMPMLANFLVAHPSQQEQQKILDYIKAEILKIETLISKYQKQIDLMQEYRTALISQAVTGKIDVRDWQLPHN